MIRGTTPTHTFNVSIDTSRFKIVRIYYAQKKIPVVTKTEKDIVMDGKQIRVTLSQKDTLKFDERRPVEVQIRVVLDNGCSIATSVGTLDVGRVLNGEELP